MTCVCHEGSVCTTACVAGKHHAGCPNEDRSAGRYCGKCRAWGSHHTDKHDALFGAYGSQKAGSAHGGSGA